MAPCKYGGKQSGTYQHLVRAVFVDTAFRSLYCWVWAKLTLRPGVRVANSSILHFSKEFSLEHDAIVAKKAGYF